jgi:hypothetical protein
MNEDPKDIFAAAAEPPEDGAERFEMEVPTDGIDPYDHSAEREAISSDAQDVSAPEQPERLTAPVSNPAMFQDPVGDLKKEIEGRFSADYDIGKVTVDEQERQRFVRAALHDKEMWFDVKIEGVNAVVRVAIPTETFTTSVGAAATYWGKLGHNDSTSDMQWLLSFQQMHAWFQIREIDGEPTEWSDEFSDGVPRLAKLRGILKDPEEFETFFSMSAPRWRMLVEAMRIAEFKYKLCLEAWQDRSFFTSAGIA